jgi:hypothetical protein
VTEGGAVGVAQWHAGGWRVGVGAGVGQKWICGRVGHGCMRVWDRGHTIYDGLI